MRSKPITPTERSFSVCGITSVSDSEHFWIWKYLHICQSGILGRGPCPDTNLLGFTHIPHRLNFTQHILCHCVVTEACHVSASCRLWHHSIKTLILEHFWFQAEGYSSQHACIRMIWTQLSIIESMFKQRCSSAPPSPPFSCPN